ncbi:MAG: glycosyl hydrolase 53 family protein [Methanocellales archaeon]
MLNKNKKSLILIAIIVSIFISGCIKSIESNSNSNKYSLPISQRNFYLGLVPTPKNWPNSSFADIAAAYEETGRIAEVSMIWVEKQGIGEFELLKKNNVINGARVHKLRPVITLNFAAIKQGVAGLAYVIDAPEGIASDLSDYEFRSKWIKEAKDIAREFKPEYFSLGNEINDYFYLHPRELNDYLSLFDEAKKEIKSVSPETKVFVVFSYNHLIENNQWELLEKFDSRVDIVGLTSYPWKQYQTPQEIPEDYYSRVKQHTSKPIAFTEIGWISSPPASEKQQSEFLMKFLELTKGLKIEMINWLFLHEIQLTGTIGKISDPKTGTIALKRSDGTEKDSYNLWLALKKLRKQ